MRYNRSMIALIVCIFCMPFLIGFMFYLIALSQQHKLSWYGFANSLWAGPYFAVGGLVCIIACMISLYWLRTDNKVEIVTDISKVSASERISHSVIIEDIRWSKFQALGGVDWLDKAIDEA